MKNLKPFDEFINENSKAEKELNEGKSDAIYQFAKEIYDAGAEGGKHTFGVWWKDNQVRMTKEFNKI
jgi:hypothetical protein